MSFGSNWALVTRNKRLEPGAALSHHIEKDFLYILP